MSDRVAVYIDFDNVVISHYDSVHGDGAWRKDNARDRRELGEAEVDLGAIIDYAASFGTVAFSRAYADWSAAGNAAYKAPLVDRSIELVQLFTISGLKNGADIRLSVDAVEDLELHPDITHVVFVAGDSDYVPLAQRLKSKGRYVVGIGVAGATAKALVAACNEFIDYAELPGVTPVPAAPKKTAAKAAAKTAKATEPAKAPAKRAAKKTAKTVAKNAAESPAQAEATALLVRAVRVGLQKSDDDWIKAGGVKSQMQRMNPAFKEKALGFSSFRAFVESRSTVVESKVDEGGQQSVRLVG